MRVADQTHLGSSEFKSINYDGLIVLSYAAFAVTFLALIYLDSMSAGTAARDFVTMSVFP
jgi:hypothetical protein